MFTLANVPKRYWEFKKPDGRTLHVEPPKLKVLCRLEELAKCETEQTTHLAECVFLKYAKVNGTDVNTSVQLVTRAMGDAGIAAEDYGSVLDSLTVAGQKSGISVDTLATNLAKYGAPMRQLGLDTQQSIALFAGWEKAGVNTEIA